jgi:AcrR family transcriptional regulator
MPGKQSTGATSHAGSSDRRTAIADAVIDLLGSPTTRRVTHRAVDRALGLAEGSSSAYFRTRAQLLAAAAERLAERDRTALTALMTRLHRDEETREPARAIAAVVDDWTSGGAGLRQMARLELQLEARAHPEVAETFARSRALFVGAVDDQIRSAQPTLAPSSSRALAVAIISLVEGLVSSRLLHGDSFGGDVDSLHNAVRLLMGGSGG